jgi:hypothetical protein
MRQALFEKLLFSVFSFVHFAQTSCCSSELRLCELQLLFVFSIRIHHYLSSIKRFNISFVIWSF